MVQNSKLQKHRWRHITRVTDNWQAKLSRGASGPRDCLLGLAAWHERKHGWMSNRDWTQPPSPTQVSLTTGDTVWICSSSDQEYDSRGRGVDKTWQAGTGVCESLNMSVSISFLGILCFYLFLFSFITPRRHLCCTVYRCLSSHSIYNLVSLSECLQNKPLVISHKWLL